MAGFRVVSGKAWWFIASVAMALPVLCHAENAGGYFNFGPGALFIIGAIIGLPSAILCVMAEAIFPRRRMPLWLTGLSLVTGVVSIALVVVGMKAAAQQHADSRLVALFLVPPMVALALRGTVSAGPHRLAAGWVIAIASLGLIARSRGNGEAVFVMAGTGAVCLLLWSVTLLILGARRLAPEAPAGDAHVLSADVRSAMAAVSAASSRLGTIGTAMSRAVPQAKPGSWMDRQLIRLQPAQAGLAWWFASACVLYVGIGLALSAGKLGGGGWLYVEWQYVADLFGLRYPKPFVPAQFWWRAGLPWSLVAGSAFWGLAGLVGGFDPGRARAVRFAAIVFGGALLVWTASIITQIAETNAREEQASGNHR